MKILCQARLVSMLHQMTEELSLNHENKPKKLNIEQSEVRIVVFDSSQHVTPREKGLIVRIIVLLILA